jgi:hypothetical protein
MAMEEALVARLKAATGVPSKVAWFERPREGGLPCVTLQEVSAGEDWTHDGPDGLDSPRVQMDCWATTGTAAMAAARALKAEMERTDTVTVGGWIFHPASLELKRATIDELDGGTKVFRVQQDFEFYHQST